ncbi:molybdate ABC transporter substrate-binding protein [Billgrantia kenyensis]|uniref:Molybdate ABC transporter substrate-binding protein n=1 Tax=Billgrantia kenyensis TaxID=321266 RepID=A0A7V9VZQ4_9GAMM|nr:molybdate ABC transporter substrate-binding protein [Halomonas kenyensis]MBA2778381.1 molybdate ABC transporter substrate-binding protein [Halomonas kenyensis]MCG6660687.1 molybdate ABC transporter substrate-binding protein [Halomonas kenyensis]
MPPFVKRLLVGVAILMTSLGLATAQASPQPVRIAAASDLRFAMDEILENFSADHPDHPVEVVYGSSGRFRSQIEHGAPFDLFFSADIAYPLALKEAGHAAGKVIPYAEGRIVIWSDGVDASALTLEDLADERFRRIAIANPRHAPYGDRAQEALRASDRWEALERRLVFGENIAHTMQLVQSGAAEVGIIALALVRHPAILDQGGYHLIDDALHAPLTQGFIITRRAADNSTARLFADYMGSAEARNIMHAYGFVLPDE